MPVPRCPIPLFPLLLLLLSAPLSAQQPTPPRDSAPPAASIFHRSDLTLLAGFTAATVAMFPLDRRIATQVRDSALVANTDLENAAKVIGFLGSAGPFIIGGTMYAVGRWADMPRAAHLAVHTGEAVLVGLGVTGLLKATLGRARPHVAGHDNPHTFRFLKGFTGDDYQAFPSGHTTTAFAVASAVTAETSEWWPRSTWIVGPVLYGGAALVGLSRMYEDKHWASDVVTGAAIGVFAGLKTVRFTHTREGNRIDRWLLGDDAESQGDEPSGAGGAGHKGSARGIGARRDDAGLQLRLVLSPWWDAASPVGVAARVRW